ncbi:MAG: YggS family pyridoxal phosphate-dependent enzyme [Oscillospiraceae bacterium]|nr:YggS family pyridoxal phosphate-dependent enzyme [Oscillospiraceae bacterium]
MSQVTENIKRLKEQIAQSAVKSGRNPDDIRLMAVTKTQPPALVNQAIAAGITLLGENRAQELCEKYDNYDKREELEIHFIGHLQTNKVKSVIDKVTAIQSVDSLKLAGEISKQAVRAGITTDLLIEVNIGEEESKAGTTPDEVEKLARKIAALPGVRVRGLMSIPPIWNENAGNERFFAQMQEMLVDIRDKNIDNISMEILSMGMSGDFDAAIKHGSTLVRLGTAIFGQR